jgi:hypothetical protein
MMNRWVKILSGLVILMILLNGFLLTRIWRGSTQTPPPVETILEERMNFNAAQVEAFKRAHEQHRERMRPVQQQLRKLKYELHQKVALEDTGNLEMLVIQIRKLRGKEEELHLEFIQSLFKICKTKDQRMKLNELLNRAFKGGMMGRGPQRGRGKR